jgi:hypothetical protein
MSSNQYSPKHNSFPTDHTTSLQFPSTNWIEQFFGQPSTTKLLKFPSNSFSSALLCVFWAPAAPAALGRMPPSCLPTSSPTSWTSQTIRTSHRWTSSMGDPWLDLGLGCLGLNFWEVRLCLAKQMVKQIAKEVKEALWDKGNNQIWL